MWTLLFGLLPLARSQNIGVTAELSLDQTQLLPNEKMYLKLTIHNRSGQDLRLGTEGDWVTFTVTGEKNVRVAPLGNGQVYAEGETNVPSGMTASRVFNLAPYFDLRQPGSYAVKATIKVPQWGQEILVPAIPFSIIKGVRLGNLPELDEAVGVPLPRGSTNQRPELRRFFLEKSAALASAKLFVRLTDGSGTETIRLVPLGPCFTFSQPEVKLDRYNVLHVLHQTGSKDFSYCAVDTRGQILERRTFQYTDRRPALRGNGDGGVDVVGGTRVESASDLPPP